jgi:hypothetical protein
MINLKHNAFLLVDMNKSKYSSLLLEHVWIFMIERTRSNFVLGESSIFRRCSRIVEKFWRSTG